MRILPRPFGQVLSDAINTLGRIWRPLLSTALIVFIPMGVLTLIVFEMSGATEFLELIFSDPAYVQSLPRDVLLDLAQPFLSAGLIALSIQAVATVFVYLVAHRLVIAAEGGSDGPARLARVEAARRFLPTAGAVVIALVIVIGLLAAGFMVWTIPLALVGTPNATSGLIALILFVVLLGPGVWAGVSMSMLTPVMATEKRGVLGSLRRSLQLVQGRWWPTLGYLLLVGLLGSVAIQMIQLVAIPLSSVGEVGAGISVVSLLGIVAQGLIVAAMGAMFTYWYIDLRARSEALLSDDLV